MVGVEVPIWLKVPYHKLHIVWAMNDQEGDLAQLNVKDRLLIDQADYLELAGIPPLGCNNTWINKGKKGIQSNPN